MTVKMKTMTMTMITMTMIMTTVGRVLTKRLSPRPRAAYSDSSLTRAFSQK